MDLEYLLCYDGEFRLDKFFDLNFPKKIQLKDKTIILKEDLIRKLKDKIEISEKVFDMLKEYIIQDTMLYDEKEIVKAYIESLEDIVKYYVFLLTKYPPKDVLLVVDRIEDIPILILKGLNRSEEFLDFIKESIAYSIPYARAQLLKEEKGITLKISLP